MALVKEKSSVLAEEQINGTRSQIYNGYFFSSEVSPLPDLSWSSLSFKLITICESIQEP